MARQSKLFDEHTEGQDLPEGMSYRRELITAHEEKALLARVRELPFKNFQFHGHTGKRRTVSFGWQYEFSGRGALRKADDIPDFLLPLRAQAAKFARLPPASLEHVLVIEYGPGAGIGWHRDKPVFGNVIGISVLARCTLRFRKAQIKESEQSSANVKAGWERFNLQAEPRSAYLLTGPARHEWEHSILSMDELRYSITFRSLNESVVSDV
jgi:alkylated DNA repair dioxygenase AlkB